MTNKMKHNPWADKNFEPWSLEAHAADLARTDTFNRMVNEDRPSDLRREIQRLANAGDPQIIGALEEAGVDDPRIPKKFFLSDGQPATIYADSDGWHAILETQEGQRLKFTSPDRTRAMFLAQEHLDKERAPHQLSETELLRVANLVQSGQTPAALELFIQLSLGKQVTSKSASEVLENPKYRSTLNQAAYAVWKFSRQDFSPCDEFIEVLNEVAATKPLTIPVIDALYDKFADDRAHLVRSARRSAEPATPESEPVVTQDDLERLSTAEIAKLRTAALQERGRRVRQFDQEVLGRE